jgi:hypothetical protein
MKAKSRKQQLIERAERFCDRMEAKGPAWDNSHDGYVAGYKAVMCDLRKMVRECYADSAGQADPEKRIKMRNHCVRVRLERFLRPLR